MSLRQWADRLLQASASPDVIELHIKDVAVAFLTGLRTNDGQLFTRHVKQSADPVELVAAMSAITRLSECDDIHLASCVTPGAIVIPIALALAADHSEDTITRAISAGYAAGIGLGTAIGGASALARGIWPTLLAAPAMAAATASCLTSRDPERLARAIRLALPVSNGRIGNPATRWSQLALTVSHGMRAAEAAHRGERSDIDRLPDDADIAAFESAASIATVGFKPFPIARQGANAVVAFQHLLAKGDGHRRIDSIEVFVPSINTTLLNRPVSENDRLSRLCNMGLQIAGAALTPNLLYDPERIAQTDVLDFARRVTVTAASDLESHWPNRWAARVAIGAGGEQHVETVIQAPFDHDAPSLPQFLQQKWRRMLSEEDFTLLNLGQPASAPYATLWQQIERRLRTTAED